jgi:beta-fructofuranosidase
MFERFADGVPVGDVIPFFDEGVYHLFCLAPPAGALFFPERLRTSWRHLRSTDLLSWEELPVALEPGEDGTADHDGVWTGSVIRAHDGYHIFYTGHSRQQPNGQSVCHATSEDCVVWHKDPGNPISTPDRERFLGQDWRDPFVFWNEVEACYWMLLSTRATALPAPSRGAVTLCTSPDLKAWSRPEILCDTFLTHCPECPEIFQLGDRWVLAYSRFSDRPRTVYRFAVSPRGPWRAFNADGLDGPNWYAAKSLSDGSGRRLAFGWVPDRNPEPTPETGEWLWGGGLAIPREISLAGDELAVRLPREIAVGQRQPRSYHALWGTGDWTEPSAGSFHVEAHGRFGYCVLDPDGSAHDYVLSLSLSWSEASIIGVVVNTNRELTAGVAILCYPNRGVVSAVDFSAPRSDGGLEPASADYKPVAEGFLRVPTPGNVAMRIAVRGDVVEAFLGDRVCLSYRLASAADHSACLLVQHGSADFEAVTWETL